MLQRMFAFLLLPLLASTVCAQGLDTQATKDDWEEINFEFNSSVLVDGFPSLLRIGELLQKNTGYKVTVEGHTDLIGGNTYNEKLGLARATAVRDFLVKYGARAGQITVTTRGKVDPKYPGGREAYSRTDEARWMNRRVALTVLDDQGRTVSAGSAGDAIRALQPAPTGVADCCSEVLKRLDKLDSIEKMLMDLADQNKKLADELARLRQDQEALANRVNQPPPPAPPAPRPPSVDEVAKAVTDAIDKKTLPKFQLLGFNVGANNNGDLSFTGKGRYFAPFGNNYAFQSEGEYLYNTGQREGQFDFGLVDRVNRFQAGLFGSFKHVNLAGDQTGGTIGQASFTAEYLFKWGKVGVFGTKAFLDDAIVNRANVISPTGVFMNNFVTERYLRVVDQAGASGTGPLFGKNYFETDLGYLRSTAAGDRFGGTLRLIFPVSRKIALTVEGGMNETLLGPGNNGRAVVGVRFGEQQRRGDFLTANHPAPMFIPRVRYEVLTRTVRTGNSAPVADAGPNQTLSGAATVKLDGSASYDPDGDPITYQWTQETGPTVALATPTAVTTTFAAVAGQSYAFRLTVKDSLGAQSSARVSITTGSGDVTILSFAANPTTINLGQSSTLGWQVINADTVTITPTLNSVPLTGSQAVSPTVTTVYTLTATRGSQTKTATATVTVTTGAPPVITSFTANPPTISSGQSSVLTCTSTGATSITINGVTTQGSTGSLTVSPAQTTTYPCVATNPNGSVTAQATVTVTGTGAGPVIASFTATPSTIAAGASSVLACTATGATSVAINGVTTQGTKATSTVTPPQTTTYTCVATGANNQTDTKQVTVTVTQGPVVIIAGAPVITADHRHIYLDATASTSPNGNTPLTYHWDTYNAQAVTLRAENTATPEVILPESQGYYTFNLTVTDSKGVSAMSTITILLTTTIF